MTVWIGPASYGLWRAHVAQRDDAAPARVRRPREPRERIGAHDRVCNDRVKPHRP